MKKRVWILSSMSMLAILMLDWLAFANDFIPTDNPSPLRNLGKVMVAIGDLRLSVPQTLTEDQLLMEAERKLQLAGIKVLSVEEWLKTPGRPVLYITLELIPIGPTIRPRTTRVLAYAFHVSVTLKEQVTVERKATIDKIFATTWEKTRIGQYQIGQSRTEDLKMGFLTDAVEELLDKFINDYLSVNSAQAKGARQ